MERTGNERERKILRSWKEIASYIGCGVRTVQRYERRLGLPVRRAGARSRTSVIAVADDVDAWLRQTYALGHRKSDKSVCPYCSGTGVLSRTQFAAELNQPQPDSNVNRGGVASNTPFCNQDN